VEEPPLCVVDRRRTSAALRCFSSSARRPSAAGSSGITGCTERSRCGVCCCCCCVRLRPRDRRASGSKRGEAEDPGAEKEGVLLLLLIDAIELRRVRSARREAAGFFSPPRKRSKPVGVASAAAGDVMPLLVRRSERFGVADPSEGRRCGAGAGAATRVVGARPALVRDDGGTSPARRLAASNADAAASSSMMLLKAERGAAATLAGALTAAAETEAAGAAEMLMRFSMLTRRRRTGSS
jgi:hypothetical protein